MSVTRTFHGETITIPLPEAVAGIVDFWAGHRTAEITRLNPLTPGKPSSLRFKNDPEGVYAGTELSEDIYTGDTRLAIAVLDVLSLVFSFDHHWNEPLAAALRHLDQLRPPQNNAAETALNWARSYSLRHTGAGGQSYWERIAAQLLAILAGLPPLDFRLTQAIRHDALAKLAELDQAAV